MAHSKSTPADTKPKRTRVFFSRGFQLRYVILVAGSLLVLLLFAGLHGIFIARESLGAVALEEFKPILLTSTWRLFFVGLIYVGVVSVAALFLSHKAVGAAGRIESEIRAMTKSKSKNQHLHIREGEELESLVDAINNLLDKTREKK